MKKTFLILILTALSFADVYALCIGCGCQRAYTKCMSHNVSSDWCLTNPCGEKECKGQRRGCHGTGIRIQLGIANPIDPDFNDVIEIDWERFEDSKLNSNFKDKLTPIMPVIEKAKSGVELTEKDYDAVSNVGNFQINQKDVQLLYQSNTDFDFLKLFLAFVLGIVSMIIAGRFIKNKD